MKPETENQVATIEFDEIEFTETSTTIITDAIREYEESKSELIIEDDFSADSTWGFLSHQVVGHEVGR